jgi:hypothetical protein
MQGDKADRAHSRFVELQQLGLGGDGEHVRRGEAVLLAKLLELDLVVQMRHLQQLEASCHEAHDAQPGISDLTIVTSGHAHLQSRTREGRH